MSQKYLLNVNCNQNLAYMSSGLIPKKYGHTIFNVTHLFINIPRIVSTYKIISTRIATFEVAYILALENTA